MPGEQLPAPFPIEGHLGVQHSRRPLNNNQLLACGLSHSRDDLLFWELNSEALAWNNENRRSLRANS